MLSLMYFKPATERKTWALATVIAFTRLFGDAITETIIKRLIIFHRALRHINLSRFAAYLLTRFEECWAKPPLKQQDLSSSSCGWEACSLMNTCNIPVSH